MFKTLSEKGFVGVTRLPKRPMQLQRPRMAALDLLAAQNSYSSLTQVCATLLASKFPFSCPPASFSFCLFFRVCGIPPLQATKKKKEIPSFLSVSPSAPWRECNKLICIFQHSLTLSSGEMEATAGTFKTKIWVVKDRDKPHSRHFLPVIPTKGDTTQKWSCGWRILQDTQRKSESKSIRNRNSMTL